MTYFPPLDPRRNEPKECPGCGGWFVPTPGMENVSCTVLHAPGSCCHYSETEVPVPTRDVRDETGKVLRVEAPALRPGSVATHREEAP